MSVKLSSASRSNERLAARRRRSRHRAFIALCVFITLLLGAGIYGLWQSAVRITRVEVLGADSSLEVLARNALQGSYLGIIPHDSIFFFPASIIRESILDTYKGTAAVSISRTGFSSISIKVDNRVPIARWCGLSSIATSPEDSPLKKMLPTASGECYLFDASGFVYATATEAFSVDGRVSPAPGESNQDKTLTSFILFSLFKVDAVSAIGATLKDANQLPMVFDFARQLGLSGPPVRTVVIRGDEVDFFFATSTYGTAADLRVTYLLGDEQNSFAALVSAKSTLNLSDPSLQYVDLRFPGKVYLKKKE